MNPTTNVLLVLGLPEPIAATYHDRLRAQFPHVKIDRVDHYSKVDPLIADAEVLITFPAMIRDETLIKAPRLKWAQALTTGVDGLIDLPSLRPDVIVTNVRGIHGAPVSESALLSMLALARQMPRSIRAQDRHQWDVWPSSLLDGKTVGILGVGAIAEALAPRCKAMGLRVIGISTTTERKPAAFDEMRPRDRLAEAVADLDFFVLLTPLTPQTRHIVDARIFNAMKPTSYLVNVARGGIVKEDDLLAALQEGRIAGASLDAFEQEPLPPDHPLWTAPNVIVTAHIAGFNDEYADRAIPILVHNLKCFIEGRTQEMLHRVKR
jgi:D-2-hydroxyacid dehydrogenase (NADP+)